MMKFKELLVFTSLLVAGSAAGMERQISLSSKTVSTEFETMRETFKAQCCTGITVVEYNGNHAFKELFPGLSIFLSAFNERILALKSLGGVECPAWLRKAKKLKVLIDMAHQSDADRGVTLSVDNYGVAAITLFQQFFAGIAEEPLDDWFTQFVMSLRVLRGAEETDEYTGSMVVRYHNPMGDEEPDTQNSQEFLSAEYAPREQQSSASSRAGVVWFHNPM